LALAQHIDFALINVNTNYRVSQIGQARARDQTNVSGSNNTYFHLSPPKNYASELRGDEPFGEMKKHAGPEKRVEGKNIAERIFDVMNGCSASFDSGLKSTLESRVKRLRIIYFVRKGGRIR
jgi:hypothetical protein